MSSTVNVLPSSDLSRSTSSFTQAFGATAGEKSVAEMTISGVFTGAKIKLLTNNANVVSSSKNMK
ncbi:MAG: hypothetical protein QM775_10735 [Pirellulales bacterium]